MEKKLKFTINKSILPSAAITFFAIIFGLNTFFSQWAYSENGHTILLWSYLVCCAVLFMLIRIKKAKFAVPLIIVMAIIILYANQKFEWRKNYILESKNGRPFILMPYIDAYPSYEDTLFWFINEKPRYVDFVRECYEPALNNQQAGRDCNSRNQIIEKYKFDVVAAIDNYYQKMKYTAQQIESQAFTDISGFEQCLRDRQCAVIPLLPADSGEVPEQSNQYLEVRKKFWSLIEDDTISEENCDFVDLCRAMKSLGVYTISTPKISEIN
jgi:hypothetical protein